MKKKSCCFCKLNLFNLTLLLQFHLMLSSSKNPLSENRYGDCVPKKCGNQTIQYPFHIQNYQKPYCGYPGFGVSCSNDSFPIFNLSTDAYVIKNISYETQEFQVVNSAIIDGVAGRRDCFQSLHNLSMPPNDLINFSTNLDYIYVFPNCSEKIITEYGNKRVECGSLAVYRNDTKLKDLEEMCKGKAIAVPYYDEGQTKDKVMDLLERGVLLNWKAYNCSACLESGGQCGFDELYNQFNCYCPDRTRALHCISAEAPDSENHYGDCVPKRCGNQIVQYPFHLQNHQKPYCGHPGFGVSCSNDSFLIFNLSRDAYIIKHILYERQEFQVVNSALVDGVAGRRDCFQSLHNLSMPLNDSINFSTNYNYIYVFPNCSDKVLTEYGDKRVGCGSLAVYRNDSILKDLEEMCKGETIEVPYYDEGQTEGKVMGMLQRGVLLNWKAYDCTSCLESGGQCGFDEPNNQFNCFCPDGVHALLCASPPPPLMIDYSSEDRQDYHRPLPLIAIIGSSFGAVVLIAFIVICAKRRQRTKKFTALWTTGNVMNQNVEAFLKSYGSFAPKRYTYGEIRKMTGNFKDKLGEGGYGAVYKGKLHDSRLVAVKKLKRLKGDGDDFINEVVSMGRTNHVNIVTLLGFCFEGNKRALVFEFLPNGSLEKFIYSSASSQSLPSDTLFSIAVGIAKGLDYLHRGCNTRILHFDIKPHNILLDDELRPKISDFGLARLCPPKESLISMSEARGTIGYIAPEVFCRNFGGVSHKSDVYSYGMMLLDMVCGRNNVVAEAQRTSDMYFPDWIYSQLELRDEIENDGIINDDQSKQLQRKMILVGLWCIQSYPSNRPPMNRVIEMLEGQLESLQVPPKPHLSSPPNPEFDSSENSMLSMGN